MTSSSSPDGATASGATRVADRSAVPGGSRGSRPGGFRERVHRTPAVALAWRVGVFLAGLVCIAGGVLLAVLPGPLTIPPVLLGLWIWSREFRWAHRLFQAFQRKAVQAWEHAKQHPVSSTAVTVGGLALVVAAVVVVQQFDLVDRARAAVGI
jgi:uncharacterized membrane protein YbaN (DUF454 family)